MTRPDDHAPIALPSGIVAAIVAHARAEAPLESCGLVAGDAPFALGGHALRYLPLENALASAVEFAPDDAALVRATLALDQAAEAVWAIVHSHPRTAAHPSPRDLAGATDPGALYLIVGPLDVPEDGVLRAWTLHDGVATEVSLTRVPDR